MKFCTCILAVLVSVLTIISCSQKSKEETLARQYCGSCHLYPEPGLLDKKSWDKVLPEMAFRMGFADMKKWLELSEGDRHVVTASIPDRPMITEEEWKSIENFYKTSAPDSLQAPSNPIKDELHLFEASTVRFPFNTAPFTTLIRSDSSEKNIYVGTRFSALYHFNDKLEFIDSTILPSPPSDLLFTEKPDPLVLLMGIMDPNDQARGQLAALNLQQHQTHTIIDSLKRPVQFVYEDLNKDGRKDFVVCAFGNYTGDLSAYEQHSDGTFTKHTLQYLPGARKAVVKDFDGNGLKDILVLMTQGDERILLFYNLGGFKFRITTLLRFPSVYGSSYFDVADFNKDGKFDILYTNGDNADYSPILKPYHGVRIFLNDGNNEFHESWFFPMHGAGQAVARDFDKDGDVDIAAIAFFPDFNKYPEQGFIYFESTPKGYIPQVTPKAAAGRWINLQVIDLEHDGDEDLLAIALDFPPKVPKALYEKWMKEKTSMLVLKNKLH
jgi:hypothetical protein